MPNDTSELFAIAAKFFLRKYKSTGGSQSALAKELGITQPYLSSVLTGSRSASFELYTQLANKLYGPLDKFLTVGRRIKEGQEPLVHKLEEQDDNDIEHLITRLTYFIMDHKRISSEIKELKIFYENIIENLQSAVLVMNSTNKVIFANKRIENICGIRPNEILGKSPFNIEKSIPGLQIYPFIQKFIEAHDQLSPHYFENIPVVTPRGDSHYNSGWLIPLIKDGMYDGMICTLRDTSNSHALFNLLTETVEHIPEGIVIVHQKAPGVMPTAFFANTKFREILCLDEVDPFSLPFEELITLMKKNVLNKDDWEKFIKDTIKNNTVHASFIIKHRNGKKYSVTGTPLTDKHGVHIGRMAQLTEIQ